jgi:hypothetical protein
MWTSLRSHRLEFAGRMFGVDGKLALAEHYASLPDSADFTWGAALEHIAYRLQLSVAGLTRLAVAVASEQLCLRHMTTSSHGIHRHAVITVPTRET